jgi:hypothetical protein
VSHFDITPDNRSLVVARLTAMVDNAPPDTFDAGRYWYDRAHAAAANLAGVYDVEIKNAAGVIAAVSPNLDAIDNFYRIIEIVEGTDTLHVTGRQRHKALSCLCRDPTEVLNPVTGPKTWSFFWNIYAPSLRERVTIDGRFADIIADAMRPWKAKRGIDTGGPGTRYESYEHVTEDAARHLRRSGYPWMTAVQVQAITWMEAKRIEFAQPHCKGLPRKQGPHRKGQSYTEMR